jgi:hypothetical protein
MRVKSAQNPAGTVDTQHLAVRERRIIGLSAAVGHAGERKGRAV